MCRCVFLQQDDFPRIVQTFDEAFADYYIKRKTSCASWLAPRCVKNGVDLECSVAALDSERMVGITLVGLDMWQGQSAAFDAATGIIPDYRGRGLARRMFDFALPRLKERGVQKFVLEVLQVNEPAIKAYQRTGFAITREFDCFELKIADNRAERRTPASLEIRRIGVEQVLPFIEHAEWIPSWENAFSSIHRASADIMAFGAFVENICAGEIVYFPPLNWIVSLVVHREYRRRGIATALIDHLLQYLPSDRDSLRVTNVDCTDVGMTAFFPARGFTSFARQYEMELDLYVCCVGLN